MIDGRVELVARAICNAHRTWPGRSSERQKEIVEAAWPSHVEEAIAAILVADASHSAPELLDRSQP